MWSLRLLPMNDGLRNKGHGPLRYKRVAIDIARVLRRSSADATSPFRPPKPTEARDPPLPQLGGPSHRDLGGGLDSCWYPDSICCESFRATYGVALVYIDVEGHEDFVVRGANVTLSNNKATFSVEIHVLERPNRRCGAYAYSGGWSLE